MNKPLPLLFQKEALEEYDFGRDHPFGADRFDSFLRTLDDRLGRESYELVDSEPVPEEEALRVADQEYVEFTRDFFNSTGPKSPPSEFSRFHSADNAPGRFSGRLELGARAVLGQARRACELVRSGAERAVSVGGGLHHAKPNAGEGFCIYNDVAYTANYLLEEENLERVMVLDTDAHAGNGTYEYFARVPEVLLVDLHQDPATIYPGTGRLEEIGEGEGEGYTVNAPLPEGAGDDSYDLVFREVVRPLAEDFEPEVLLRNGGGDPYFDDPLTDLGLTLEGLNSLGRSVEALRRELGCGLVDMIVSGYSGEKLHSSWLALISGLLGEEPGFLEGSDAGNRTGAYPETKEVVEEVKRVHGDYWGL